MTEFSDVVERQLEIIKAEEWGKQVKMIIGENGYVTFTYNNGDKCIIESKTGKETWEYVDKDRKEPLLDKFHRWLADGNKFRE